ncbi:MAG: polyprenol monophosphomannose synthase [Methanocellales archaeon]
MISIIVPTYNERGNIEVLIKKIFEVAEQSKFDLEVIVVDDDSPDQTWRIAEDLKSQYKNLQVLRRLGKKGLASAVIDGLKIARGDIIGVMDADLSHPPDLILSLIEPLINGKADLAIASRYIPGSDVENWPLAREAISKIAISLAKPLVKEIKDPISGYFFLKREVINGVELNPRGFKIGLEVFVKGRYDKAVEVPYTFRNRKRGESKFGIREIFNYLIQLLELYAHRS